MILFGTPRICTSNFKDGSTIVLALCVRNDSSHPLFKYNFIVFVEFGLNLKATISSGSSVTGMKILAFVCFSSLFSSPSEVKALELGYTLLSIATTLQKSLIPSKYNINFSMAHPSLSIAATVLLLTPINCDKTKSDLLVNDFRKTTCTLVSMLGFFSSTAPAFSLVRDRYLICSVCRGNVCQFPVKYAFCSSCFSLPASVHRQLLFLFLH